MSITSSATIWLLATTASVGAISWALGAFDETAAVPVVYLAHAARLIAAAVAVIAGVIIIWEEA